MEGHKGAVNALLFLPDHSLISAASDRTVRMWREGHEVRAVGIPGRRQRSGASTCCGSPPVALAVNRTGNVVAIACDDGYTYLWSLDVDQLTQVDGGHGTLSYYGRPIVHLADDSRWTTATLEPAGYVGVRSLEGERVRLVGVEAADVSALAISDDGKLVATGAPTGTVAIWDAVTGLQIAQWRTKSFVCALRFSPDAARVAVGLVNRTVQMWHVNSRSLVWSVASEVRP